MKPLVIYHDHCTDGFGAAFAAWMKFGDDAEYLPASYGHFQWPNIKDRDVYILDFSFSKQETMDVMSGAKRFIWLDHHKTAFEMWCGSYEKGKVYTVNILDPKDLSKDHFILLDDNKSGALLAWEYFRTHTETPMLIKHIDDRDRWQFKLRGSKEIHTALASVKPWSFEQWEELIKDEHYGSMFTEGAAILRAHEQNVKSIVESGRREVAIKITVPNHGSEFSQLPSRANGYDQWFDGLAANCPPYAASDVGHELASQSGTFGLCWYQGRDGKAKVSLRSNGDYDVSAIAKTFGGGGHFNAAGFEIHMSTLQGWLK